MVNEIIRNPKWFVNNCFTDGRLTDWNFERWLPFKNPLRPVSLNKHHFSIFSHFNRSSATVLNKVISMQIHMLYKINYFFTENVCVISWIFKTEPVSCIYIYCTIFHHIRIMYIFTFHKCDSLFRSSSLWVFLLKVSGEFAEWFPCRSVISIELLCSFVGVTLRRGCSVNLLCIFRAPHCRRILNLFFAKALLSLIVHDEMHASYIL